MSGETDQYILCKCLS